MPVYFVWIYHFAFAKNKIKVKFHIFRVIGHTCKREFWGLVFVIVKKKGAYVCVQASSTSDIQRWERICIAWRRVGNAMAHHSLLIWYIFHHVTSHSNLSWFCSRVHYVSLYFWSWNFSYSNFWSWPNKLLFEIFIFSISFKVENSLLHY